MTNKKLFLNTCLIFVMTLFKANSQEKKDILFIGNSLTYFHDMPQTLQKMFDTDDDGIKIYQSTFPGIQLEGHYNDVLNEVNGRWHKAEISKNEISPTIKLLKSKLWSKVVLQGGGIGFLIPEVFQYKVEPYIILLDSIIKLQHGKTLLFQNYASSINYPTIHCMPCSIINYKLKKLNCCSDSMKNSNQEYSILSEQVNKIAKQKNIIITPVGKAFEICRMRYSTIGLIEDEGGHPTEQGSYLIACVFYTMIAEKKINTPFYGNIEKTEAIHLQSIANEVFLTKN